MRIFALILLVEEADRRWLEIMKHEEETMLGQHYIRPGALSCHRRSAVLIIFIWDLFEYGRFKKKWIVGLYIIVWIGVISEQVAQF